MCMRGRGSLLVQLRISFCTGFLPSFFRHGAQSGLFSASFHMRMASALLQSRHVGTLFSLVVCLCCIFARVINAVYVSVIDAAMRLVMKAMRSLGTL